MASAGEDFKVNFYDKNQLLLALPHPGIVWDMHYCVDLNRFFTFGEDGILRVFTTDKNKVDNNVHLKYVEDAKVASIKNPDFTDEQLKKFPKI